MSACVHTHLHTARNTTEHVAADETPTAFLSDAGFFRGLSFFMQGILVFQMCLIFSHQGQETVSTVPFK